jgi:carbon monoxide dehydrogenase subunit G
MDMTGEHRIDAPRAVVWEALNDADVLRACIPGCTELEKTPIPIFPPWSCRRSAP